MKKKIIIGCAILILVISGFFIVKEATKTDYQKAVENYESLKLEDVNNKVKNKESFILYIGTEECPYCVEFVKLLENKRREREFDISYFDEKVGDTPENIQKLREQYQVDFLPRIIVFEKGKAISPETPRNQQEVNDLIEKYQKN